METLKEGLQKPGASSHVIAKCHCVSVKTENNVMMAENILP